MAKAHNIYVKYSNEGVRLLPFVRVLDTKSSTSAESLPSDEHRRNGPYVSDHDACWTVELRHSAFNPLESPEMQPEVLLSSSYTGHPRIDVEVLSKVTKRSVEINLTCASRRTESERMLLWFQQPDPWLQLVLPARPIRSQHDKLLYCVV